MGENLGLLNLARNDITLFVKEHTRRKPCQFKSKGLRWELLSFSGLYERIRNDSFRLMLNHGSVEYQSIYLGVKGYYGS